MGQSSPAYRRILLKLSGEALLGGQDYGIDPVFLKRIAGEKHKTVLLLIKRDGVSRFVAVPLEQV